MKLIPVAAFSGVFKIQYPYFEDKRGYFIETFKRSDFTSIIEQMDRFEIIQTNLSFSKQNVIRGLHFQKAPYAQGKIINCLQGKILDVILDVRPESSTFGQWQSFLLGDIHSGLWIPPGFAHGFEALAPQNLVQYAAFNAEYAPDYEGGIYYADPELNLPWQALTPEVSTKDRHWPTFSEWKSSQ